MFHNLSQMGSSLEYRLHNPEATSFTCICFSRFVKFFMYCVNWLIISGLFIIHLCIK